MRGAIVDPVSDPAWRALACRVPEATIFHHPAWIGLLREHYRYPVAAVCALDAGGEALAGIPVALVASRLTGRRLVALPFSDRCEPLLAPGADEGALGVVAAALERERQRRGVVLEVRAAFPQAGTPREHALLHVVDLTGGLEAVRARFRPATRRNVRKAVRLGVEFERRTDRAALEAFYDLHLETRHRLGVPTQPKGFIVRLETLFAAGMGFVGVARCEGQVVAAAVFLHVGTTLVYKYGASLASFQHARPTNLLFDETIAWACEHGFAALDLGRTDLTAAGLSAFKRGWGAEERPLLHTYAGRPPAARTGTSAAERALAATIRAGPPQVGRAIGALLYRHAG